MYAPWLIWKQPNDAVLSVTMHDPSPILHTFSHVKEVWYLNANYDPFFWSQLG